MDTMFERANKWIQRLDDHEYKILPEACEAQIPAINGGRAPLPDLLSLAMTNYQALSSTYDELQEKAKQGKLTSEIPYHIRERLPKEEQNILAVVSKDSELSAKADRTVLDTLMEQKSTAARNFLHYIDHALAIGAIVEGDALKRKLAESEREKKAISDERDKHRTNLEEVSTELISVRALYEDCQRKLHIKPVRDNQGSGN